MKALVDYLGDKKFLTGDNVCLVDFILFEFCEYGDKLSGGKTGEKYATLPEYCERVKNLPGMKEFYESEQRLGRGFMPPSVKLFD